MPWKKTRSGIMVIIVCFFLLNAVEVKGEEAEWDINKIKQSSVIYTNISSSIYYITENITIGEGETYIFDNTTVIFNTSYDGSLNIVVGNGGTLIITNNSLLTINKTGEYSNNHGYNYNIRASKGSTLRIADSKILYSGYDEQFSSGVVIESDYSTIINTSFIHSSNAIFLNNCNYSLIDGCSFSFIEKNGVQIFGLYPNSYNHTVFNCFFSDIKANCISLGQAKSIRYDGHKDIYIINNRMINSNNGIYFFPWENLYIYNNVFINIRGVAIERMYSNINNIVITNNLLMNCSVGIKASSWSLMNISNNTLFDIKGTGISIGTSNGGSYYICDNIISNVDLGMQLKGYSIFSSNNIVSNSRTGIRGEYSPNSIIKETKLINCMYGIHLYMGGGAYKIIDPTFINCSTSLYLEKVPDYMISGISFSN